MQLKYNKQIKNKVITIELETADFTREEETAMERFGEPVVKFEKVYPGGFPINIEKKLKTGFKVRVKFDGTEDLLKATEAANTFFEDIQEHLREELTLLMDKLYDHKFEFVPEKGGIIIKP